MLLSNKIKASNFSANIKILKKQNFSNLSPVRIICNNFWESLNWDEINNSLNNEIISEAVNGESVLDHAEILALKKALDKLSTNRLTNHDIYVSIEPCPMCATAIAKTHIRRLYFGNR